MYDGPIIDVFFHPPWPKEAGSDSWGTRDSWIKDPRRARVMRTFHQDGADARTPDKSVGDMIADMQQAGVEKAIFQSSAYYPTTREMVDKKHLEMSNILDSVDHDRKMFLMTGTIRPPEQGPGTTWDVMENGRILEEAKRKHGIIGVHMMPSPWGTPANHKWFYPVYAKCVELNLAVFTYIGMPGPFWPMEPNNPVHLDEVALAFPDLKIIGHHIGDPWPHVMTRLAAKHPNVYITTSAWSPKRYPPELLEFMRGKWHGQAGADKVLFGTDYPLLNLEKAARDARELDLPETVLRKFLYENAQRLFWSR